jgi:acyl-CoA synthetase (AMP-forming)/AMP-acid ligase II
MMGGRLRNALSGGGPISADVQTFVRTVFGCNMVQGYALTETCSIGCIQPMDDPRNGIVGVPLSSVEIKLESCKEVRGSLPPKQHRRNTHTHTHAHHVVRSGVNACGMAPQLRAKSLARLTTVK